jgi:hypothetical protein
MNHRSANNTRELFTTIQQRFKLLQTIHAREVIEAWRIDYVEVRPNGVLKGQTPKEYAEVAAGLY